MTGPAEIIVVPHTHWDREWYEPFQRFRLRLVALLDDVFDRMERDPRQRFTLDGQLAAVDDYLEVRPERREQVIALVKAGRLAVGPWQILLDEFLCSGENIVRNLERGLRRSAELGGAMPVGYLPDMFGHIAQMPQILVGAGLAHACVFRGAPQALHRHAFAWQAPDGTTVRTEYLPGGYGNAAGLLDDPAQVTRRAGDLAGMLAAWRFDGETTPALAMYGTDHAAPAPGAPDLLAAADLPATTLRLGTLTEYFATQPSTVDRLPVVRGELRSHARANILPGVLSVRGHLKRAMGRAERRVERYAEPLAALTNDASVQRFLDMAWTRLIDASCHDSVTGCGCDETAEQVAVRLAEGDQLGRAVCDLVGARLAAAVPRDGYLLFNPTPAVRTALVHLDVDAPVDGAVSLVDAVGRGVPAQVLARDATTLADEVVPAADLAKVLTRVHGRELYGQEVAAWSVAPGDATLTFHVARDGDPTFDVADVRLALHSAEPSETWRVRILAAPRATVAALVEVPPLGRTAVRPAPVSYEPLRSDSGSHGPFLGSASRTVAGAALDNGLLRVEVAEDGTLTLTTPDGVTTGGIGRIVDGGDVGDSYNYAPPAADELVDKPTAVRVAVRHDGPLVAVLDVVREYRWPARADVDAGSRAVDREPITVTTRVELRCGERFARLRVEFDNRCDDHRVRLHLPLPSPADTSYAEGQFAVIERGSTAEGGGGEVPLPTFPANGFVAAGGLAVLLTQPTEYELTDSGRELAVTMLRAIGMLSRNRHALRDEPAGPQLPTPEAQCRGLRTVELAILPHRGTWHEAGLLAQAEAYRHELLAFPGTDAVASALPTPAIGLSVDGEGVTLTSVRNRAGRIEARLVAQTPAETTAVLGGATIRAAWRADLLGRAGDALAVDADGLVRLRLRAWEIATVQLDISG
ncbi:glycoside hydrolase family 38 C-terminal domain-containing protein [Asanoa sp. WMMD1127]|uniref:glycoside hydrolase family 38 N-terminal domain-containing protein n=1 Tax=Asanoa sp. WMMD1127 TaxID=3016107 RepID=UPI00241776D4|nr:glycoside hydrolase family 38 C-terminal domain-containing protein [Asanoa sp. WMMD1127]MDG4825060.1 glycoside hydrolase family 38 C-terminal domain-containing protein [Asanoa sp. WMMD1127]